MSPESVNIAIAELTGWKFQQGQEPCYGGPYKATGWFSPDGVFLQGKNRNPNYHADLNAMAEAEASLSADEHYTFRTLLWEITKAKEGRFGRVNGEEHNRRYCSASAPRRAEAFLRTKGKWRDG